MRVMLVALLLAGAALAALPSVAARPALPPVDPDPLGLVYCNPDFVGVCTSTGPGAACAGVNFGLQGGWACVGTDPAAVRVCTSMYTVFYGNCPTSILGPILTFD